MTDARAATPAVRLVGVTKSFGDVVAVVNPQSKKTLQATVIAAGKVSVNAAAPARVAANTTSPSTTIER